MSNLPPGYQFFTHTAKGKSHQVFHKGDGPPVIIMHEMPGLNEPCFDFGRRLVKEGFKVYIPHLFGDLNKKQTGRNFARLCISKEFFTFKKNRSSPIVDWLKDLCRAVNKGQGVGAIGMCYTGGFAIPMLMEPSLVAPVVSQPAQPFLSKNIGCTKAEIAKVKERIEEEGLVILGFRFNKDCMSPKRKIKNYRHIFGDAFQFMPLDPHKFCCHSVFTGDFHDPDTGKPTDSTQAAWDKLIAFFKEKLSPAQ